MVGLLTSQEDMFVVDSRTPGSIDGMIRQAVERQLERICCVRPASDHPEELEVWARDLREASYWAPIELYGGLLVEPAGDDGRIDLPIDPRRVDFLLLSTRRLVLGGKVYDSGEAASLTSEGPILPGHLLQLSLVAAARAMKRHRNVILADLFSNLSELGVAEGSLPDELIELLVESAEKSGSALMINERHRCPAVEIARRFFTAGVPIFLGSGSPWTAAQGRYRYGSELLRKLHQER